MKSKTLTLIAVALFMIGCQSNKSLVASAAKKERIAKIETKLADKEFKVFFEDALPLLGRNSNRYVITGSEYISVNGDKIDMALSFYGRFLIGYNNRVQTARQFQMNTELLEYTKHFDAKKNQYVIHMKTKNGKEELTMQMKLFTNNKVILTVKSNHRTPINYYGTMSS